MTLNGLPMPSIFATILLINTIDLRPTTACISTKGEVFGGDVSVFFSSGRISRLREDLNR